jgi:hypothetical protein
MLVVSTALCLQCVIVATPDNILALRVCERVMTPAAGFLLVSDDYCTVNL